MYKQHGFQCLRTQTNKKAQVYTEEKNKRNKNNDNI